MRLIRSRSLDCSHGRNRLRFTKISAGSQEGFADQGVEDVELLVNIETITACENFQEMLAIPEIKSLHGIVIGRMDLACSLGLTRQDVNSEQVLALALALAKKAKAAGLTVAIGGGVSLDSLPFFKMFCQGHFDRFETRKVIFDCPQALDNFSLALPKRSSLNYSG